MSQRQSNDRTSQQESNLSNDQKSSIESIHIGLDDIIGGGDESNREYR